MSACNGAGTRAYSGEGLVGLSWAFLRAGAHNVIAALWEVSDSSSPQLMDSLYRGLSQGKDPATALRDAKLSMLHSSSNILFQEALLLGPFPALRRVLTDLPRLLGPLQRQLFCVA